MSDYTSPRASPPLALPPAALHAHARYEPHPDSTEAVRIERQRCAKELEPICRKRVSSTPSRAARDSLSLDTSPSHDVSARGGSRDILRRRSSFVSGRASTQAGVATCAEEEHEESREHNRRWYDNVVKFWTTQISLTIEEGAHRDHLALERTFLAYLRTSLLLAMMGIVVAQLFHLQHTPTPNTHFGFHKIGIPLAVTFICMAIVVMLVGAVRFWRLQRKLTQGKALAGGVEVLLIMGLVGMLLVGTFGLVLGIDIDKMYTGH